MNRNELVKKMAKCFATCRKDLKYSEEKAMDRVLEMVEEELYLKLDEVYEEDLDDDDYCGAV